MGDLLEARGAGTGWARGHHGRFVAAGLIDTGAEAYFEIRTGGSAGARIDAANLLQVGEGLIAAGTLTAADRDRVLTLLEPPAFTYASPAMFAAWGRRPYGGFIP